MRGDFFLRIYGHGYISTKWKITTTLEQMQQQQQRDEQEQQAHKQSIPLLYLLIAKNEAIIKQCKDKLLDLQDIMDREVLCQEIHKIIDLIDSSITIATKIKAQINKIEEHLI